MTSVPFHTAASAITEPLPKRRQLSNIVIQRSKEIGFFMYIIPFKGIYILIITQKAA